MALNDILGKRMKEYYEQIPKTKLMRRCPVIIRLDGRSFHTFTRGFQRPFDEVLIKTMQETTKYLCENIQGCVFGYTQSDEITLVLVDYKKLTSSAWFDYEVQKMCSIAASMATMAFNKAFEQRVLDLDPIAQFFDEDSRDIGCLDYIMNEYGYTGEYLRSKKHENQVETYMKALNKGAIFDARCFNVPKEEVTNCLYWRQLDASRNSIQMVGQANFSHKELQNKSCNEIQDMLMTHKGINWNDLPTYQKRGSCVVREEYWLDKNTGEELSKEYSTILSRIGGSDDAIKRNRWIIDKNIPIFKDEGREYIDKLIYVGDK